MKTAIAEADQKLSEDDWVMGETGKKEIAQSTDAESSKNAISAITPIIGGISLKT
jgi:hypothetical protein